MKYVLLCCFVMGCNAGGLIIIEHEEDEPPCMVSPDIDETGCVELEDAGADAAPAMPDSGK